MVSKATADSKVCVPDPTIIAFSRSGIGATTLLWKR